MPPLSDIGPQLVAARMTRGLSQRELAELVGVHQQQIARWEKERYGCVSLKRLSLVADALGVEPPSASGRRSFRDLRRRARSARRSDPGA